MPWLKIVPEVLQVSQAERCSSENGWDTFDLIPFVSHDVYFELRVTLLQCVHRSATLLPWQQGRRACPTRIASVSTVTSLSDTLWLAVRLASA